MDKKEKLTEIGKEIIPIELVGKNINYKFLKDSQKSAYPKGDEFRYSDDYLARLNNTYFLKDVLSKRIKSIANRERDGLASFVMGSPLNNSEGEDILAYVLINSAQAELWQPFIIDVPKLTDVPQIKTAREYLERVESISPNYNKGMIHGGILFGLSVAKRGGFVLPTEYENKVIVIPSQEFVKYCKAEKK
jgi:hypothetical protein